MTSVCAETSDRSTVTADVVLVKSSVSRPPAASSMSRLAATPALMR